MRLSWTDDIILVKSSAKIRAKLIDKMKLISEGSFGNSGRELKTFLWELFLSTRKMAIKYIFVLTFGHSRQASDDFQQVSLVVQPRICLYWNEGVIKHFPTTHIDWQMKPASRLHFVVSSETVGHRTAADIGGNVWGYTLEVLQHIVWQNSGNLNWPKVSNCLPPLYKVVSWLSQLNQSHQL